jgi:hypothetical protein
MRLKFKKWQTFFKFGTKKHLSNALLIDAKKVLITRCLELLIIFTFFFLTSSWGQFNAWIWFVLRHDTTFMYDSCSPVEFQAACISPKAKVKERNEPADMPLIIHVRDHPPIRCNVYTMYLSTNIFCRLFTRRRAVLQFGIRIIIVIF